MSRRRGEQGALSPAAHATLFQPVQKPSVGKGLSTVSKSVQKSSCIETVHPPAGKDASGGETLSTVFEVEVRTSHKLVDYGGFLHKNDITTSTVSGSSKKNPETEKIFETFLSELPATTSSANSHQDNKSDKQTPVRSHSEKSGVQFHSIGEKLKEKPVKSLDRTDFDWREADFRFVQRQTYQTHGDNSDYSNAQTKRMRSDSNSMFSDAFDQVGSGKNDDVLDNESRDPWGLTSESSTCFDKKFTSLESECSPNISRKVVHRTSTAASVPKNEYVNPRIAIEKKIHNIPINSSTSRSSADSTYFFPSKSGYRSTSLTNRRLIRWQPINSDESLSTQSDTPPDSLTERDSDTESPVFSPTRTPHHSPEDTPNLTAYHTPKLSLSSASDSEDLVYVDSRNRKYYSRRSKSSKRTKKTSFSKVTHGEYTKLDTGSSEILGTTEGNTTTTFITDNTVTQTEKLQPFQGDQIDLPLTSDPARISVQEPSAKRLSSRVDSFLSSGSSSCDAYQRVSPGGTPWTVWYRAQSLECTDVPPLIHADADDNAPIRMRRRLTEIQR